MSSTVPEPQRSSSEIGWWKDVRSASEMAERLARSHVDKQHLEHRLTELVKENTLLKIQSSVAMRDLMAERQRNQQDRERLDGEMTGLKSQLQQAEQRAQDTAGAGRREAESAARERLLKDDFEKKIEFLKTQLNKERQGFANQLQEVKAKMADCICGEIRIGRDVQRPQPHAALPKGWMIRNSK